MLNHWRWPVLSFDWSNSKFNKFIILNFREHKSDPLSPP